MNASAETQEETPAYIKLMFQAHDATGIDKKIDEVIYDLSGNILDQQAGNDPGCNMFFSRKVFSVSDYTSSTRDDVTVAFQKLADQHIQGKFSLQFPDDPRQKVVIMVSEPLHLVWDTLGRWKYGGLPLDIHHIISNHDAAKPLADAFGVAFTNVARNGHNDIDWKAVRHILD